MSQHHISNINVADATFAFVGFLQNVNAGRLDVALKFRRELLSLVPWHIWPRHDAPIDGIRPISELAEEAMERIAARQEKRQGVEG